MALNRICTTFTTKNIKEARAFYEKHFAAKAIFDCGWYLVLKLKADTEITVSFMEPQGEAPIYQGGASLNLRFDDVDSIYNNLSKEGLQETMPLENHPWGDRGFAVVDPLGTAVYCYQDREPDKEYKKYFCGDHGS